MPLRRRCSFVQQVSFLLLKVYHQTLPQLFLVVGICEKGGLTYENGEKLESGCDSVCTCMNGKMDCAERCTGSFFKKGKRIEDPLCTAKDSDDPCCSVLVCAADTGKYNVIFRFKILKCSLQRPSLWKYAFTETKRTTEATNSIKAAKKSAHAKQEEN